EAGSLGVARYRHPRGTGKMPGEPLRALRERLRMRIDLRDALDRRFLRQQVLLDAQLDLTADRELRRIHEIERAADGAFGRVLDGNDRVIRLPCLARAKDLVD